MFIAANANQLIRISTFIGTGDVWNNYTAMYLWSTTQWFDVSFLPANELPAITISNTPITIKKSSGNLNQVGINTISTCFLIIQKFC